MVPIYFVWFVFSGLSRHLFQIPSEEEGSQGDLFYFISFIFCLQQSKETCKVLSDL